ncbi:MULTISPECIES: hypothetical protein [Pseudomonas]|uniref:hypothetical protein n=1 Tax=Pseudomonas TaxID=286 RepID=UPI0016460EC9|nr:MULTISPECIES: hypothetical protein [Pseudomonas]QXH90143.1 hypothetical protein HU773_004485 [Pseudomonas shahriarae]GLH39705.1 hypothetical protein RS1P1_39890 [Pseudomonas moraviensis]
MKAKTLAQALAIDSQLGLPGSAGRLLKQIRDIEHVAPMFRDAGLIKGVKRPAVVNLTVSGIASHSCIHRALGGFIYASAAVRTDLTIQDNKVGTAGSDSVSELDDIDFEAQRKRLDLVEMRHCYALVERLLKQGGFANLILIDTPLFIDREMVPLKRNARHWAEFEKTRDVIEQFWQKNRKALFPWNPEGPVLVSILAERFSAIVSIARQDLRTEDGRKHILINDGFAPESAAMLEGLEARLSGIGDTRFINGILGNFTRTIAFRMTENRSRMEPASEVSQGVIGFHFRSARASQIKMAQLAGEESDWDSALLDTVASRLMILDMQSQKKAMPLPQLLSRQQLNILEKFSAYYRQGLNEALRSNDVESTWLSGLDEGFES